MKNTYTCLFLTLLFVGVLIIFFSLSSSTKEGFRTYAECRRDGYSKEFCVQTPTSVWGPAGCICPDGSRGIIHPGLRGECLCSRYY